LIGTGLTALEVGTFILYLAGIVTIGFLTGRKGHKDTTHFFLAGRALPWYVIGFSLIAASISSEQFIGEVGWGYKYGPEEEKRRGYPWWKRVSVWFAAVVAFFIVIYAVFW